MAERKINVDRSINEALAYLRGHFDIKEAVLFGSQTAGTAKEHSDIDLIVVSPDFAKKSYEEILNVFADLAVKHGSRVELHPYTEEEMANARPTNFIGHALRTGRIVFKAKNG